MSNWSDEDMSDNPPFVKFSDGSTYCDCGREVERNLFWYFHKDDMSLACLKQPTLGQISEMVIRKP